MSVFSPFPSTVDRLSSDEQERIAKIIEDCMLGLENGELFDIEEVANAHPELAEPLRRCLAGLQTLHDAVNLKETFPDEQPIEPVKRLGEFELQEVIGRGGMGIVYSAWQSSLQRRVALKVMQSGSMAHPNRLRRFQLEAQSAGQLQHPNIVPVYAVGHEAGVHYYAMQLIDGRSLDDCDPQEWSKGGYVALLDAAIDIASALQHAHECGIVHRDIKPSNLLIDTCGKVWITDFGLAHRLDGHSMTQSGDVLGTANYMSPEQALGKPVDERTDIYSLATTLYEMATGVQAFPGSRLADVLRKIESAEPIALRQIKPDIPVDLETILLKGMSKDREDRYLNAQSLVDDLRAMRNGLPIRGRRPSLGKVASRWIARHKPAVIMGMAGLGLALMVSLIALAKIASTRHRLSNALVEAQNYLQASNENYWQARSLLDRWNEKWLTHLSFIPAAHEARSAMLADTIQFYESFVDRAVDDPHLIRDLSTARLRLGQTYARVGDRKRATESLEAAISQWSKHPPSLEDRQRREWAIALNELGLLHLQDRRPGIAKQLMLQSIQVYESMAHSNAEATSLRGDKAGVHVNLAQAFHKLGDAFNANLHFEASDAIYRELLEEEGGRESYLPKLALLLDHRAVQTVHTDLERAESLALEAGEFHRQHLQRSARIWQAWHAYGSSLHNLAATQLQSFKPTAAVESMQQAIDARIKVTQLNPTNADAWLELATSQNALALMHGRLGKMDDACNELERAAASIQSRIDSSPGEPSMHMAMASILTNWAKLRSKIGPLDASFVDRIRTQLDLAWQHTADEDAQNRIDSMRKELESMTQSQATESQAEKGQS
jgi:eukaryotic-like serine/threonine-protein kinase